MTIILLLTNIRQKYKIRNRILMDRIVDFLMDNISNLTSARNIVDALTNNQDKINNKTVGSYLEYLLQIKDAYPKMVIARTRNEEYQYEGIRIIDIAIEPLKDELHLIRKQVLDTREELSKTANAFTQKNEPRKNLC